MDLEQTSFMREVRAVMTSGAKSIHFAYEATIHVNETNENYKATKVLMIDRVCDYEMAVADVIMVKVIIPLGKYATYIYPKKENLDITIKATPIGEVGDNIDAESNTKITRYSAVLVDTGNPTLQNGGQFIYSEDQQDRGELKEVYFQLIDKSVDSIRMSSLGGVFRGCTVGDVIAGVLGGESKKKKLIKGVNMVDSANQVVKDSIIVPHGTRLMDLPQYLHKSLGVYGAGLGYYLTDGYWYVYPCYDVARYSKNKRNVTIVNVPENRFPDIERTYRVDGTNVVILATGSTTSLDNTDSEQLTHGSGVRFADASKIMEESTSTSGNKTTVSRSAINNEVAAVERADGKNYAPVSKNSITSNQLFELSKLARRMGSVIALVWENSNPDLIYPDTMVKLKYLKQDEIIETVGVVLKAYHFTEMARVGIVGERYKTRTVISIFVKNSKA